LATGPEAAANRRLLRRSGNSLPDELELATLEPALTEAQIDAEIAADRADRARRR